MTITDVHASGVDNYAWLQMIDDHPELLETDLVAAYQLLGVDAGLDDNTMFWRLWHLETWGFLSSEIVGDLVHYTFLMPDKIVTWADIDRLEQGAA